MSVKLLLDNLNIAAKQEGSQWLINCPTCGKDAHCYVDTTTGLWHCHVCKEGGNPYQMVKHHKPDATPAEMMALLEQFGLADETTQKTEKPKKDISWLRNELRKPSTDEITRLCRSKGVARQALLSFSPYIHKTDPIMYLPVFTPGDKKACGFLRVHLDGELIKLRSGQKEKYPVIGVHGLFATLNGSDDICFTEAWRDVAAAMEAGINATASSGGASTWRDCWLPVFKKKRVAIVMDCDSAGNGGPITGLDGKVRQVVGAAVKAAQAISEVAKEVKIVKLPYKVTETHGKDLYDFLNEKK